MIRTPRNTSTKRSSQSVDAKNTTKSKQTAVHDKKKVEAAPDQIGLEVDTKKISAEGAAVNHGGSTVEFRSSPMGVAFQEVAPSGKKAAKLAIAARIKELELAGNRVIEALGDLRWNEIPQILGDVGISGAVRMASMPKKLKRPEERLHRLEWFLGQVHELVSKSDEFSGRWAGGVEHFVRNFKHAPVGTSLVEHFRANDAKEAADLASFERVQSKAGKVVSDTSDYKKVAGEGWFNAHALAGRTGTFLFLDWDTRTSKILEGKIQPKAGGSALFNLETKQGVVEVNANDIKRHALVDELPQRREELRAAANEEGMLKHNSSEFEALLGYGFDIAQLVGRKAKVIDYDPETRKFSFLEGTLAKDPKAAGSAMYALETEAGLMKLNFNHTQELWIEDRSSTPRSKLPARAKQEGYLRHQGWFNAQELNGKPAWFLTADRKAGVYRLNEGVIRPDPKAGGNALFLLEQNGKMVPMNVNDAKEIWIKS